MKKISIQDFLNEEYSQSALYNCYRMIASYVDGLKPSARKVVYTVKKRNISNEMKVSRISSAVAEETQYLHGETNLQGVIVNMTQNFVGSNNLPLLSPNGNFGSRHLPTASASRYIYVNKSENLDFLFSKLDDKILVPQEFEGSDIEPKFFVPLLPLILVNGSEGLGTGFAQKVLPRSEKEIIEALQQVIESQATSKLLKPSYKGFRGKINSGSSVGSWEITGDLEIIDSTTVKITELPIGYSLASYLKVLNRLIENKEIKSFEDLSEDDKFLFVIKVPKIITNLPEKEILDKFKLIKRVTENYTCINENNEVQVFSSPQEILESFVKVKIEFYKKRRLYLIDEIEKEILSLSSLELFVNKVISGEIKIYNVPRKEIVEKLKELDGIEEKNGSFDYLLNLPIHNFTKEKIVELQKKLRGKKKELDFYKKTSPEGLWKNDLNEYVNNKR